MKRVASIGIAAFLAVTLALLIIVLVRYHQLTRAREVLPADVAKPADEVVKPVASEARPALTVKNECLIGDDMLVFHVLFPIHYSGKEPWDSRVLYQFTCYLETKQCEGMILRADHVDQHAPLTIMDLNRASGGKLVSFVGSVATIQWGPLRTFTVDLSDGSVRYVESGEGLIAGPVEGRGEARCEIADARRR